MSKKSKQKTCVIISRFSIANKNKLCTCTTEACNIYIHTQYTRRPRKCIASSCRAADRRPSGLKSRPIALPTPYLSLSLVIPLVVNRRPVSGNQRDVVNSDTSSTIDTSSRELVCPALYVFKAPRYALIVDMIFFSISAFLGTN